MGIEQSVNFRRASPHITTSGVVDAERLHALRSDGCQVLINLLPDESKYAVADERTIVEAQGITYVYIPVDFQKPTLSDYEKFAKAVEAASGQILHIHCAANYRASAFLSLYAESKGLWSSTQASEFVSELWNPSEHNGWPEFMAKVREQCFAAQQDVASDT